MIFKTQKNISLKYTNNSVKYFQQIDILLQAIQFEDGRFFWAFCYFRNAYFDLIDKEMKKMSQKEKIEYLESAEKHNLETLAVLSRVLKKEIFENFITDMYAEKDIRNILEGIKKFPAAIPTQRNKN
ncbi:MAG: hypothetical protein J0H55_16175 [Chitinophagaceae bacterium]|nr:hypothetical protein [Chitinophagaceae bacterium]